MLHLASVQREEPYVDASVPTNIGANVMHLLLLNYDSDLEASRRLLYECLKLGSAMNFNLVDALMATPLLVALRKRQLEALVDCATINRETNQPIFDFNILDKGGRTPLHYAVEVKDYEMLHALLQDPFIDPSKVDTDTYSKARRGTIIFSAFHKLLYQQEKLKVRRQYQRSVQGTSTDYWRLVQASADQVAQEGEYVSLALTNKVKHEDFSGWSQHGAPVDGSDSDPDPDSDGNILFSDQGEPHAQSESRQTRYDHLIRDPKQFYDSFRDESAGFVQHQLFNLRSMRKLATAKARRASIEGAPLVRDLGKGGSRASGLRGGHRQAGFSSSTSKYVGGSRRATAVSVAAAHQAQTRLKSSMRVPEGNGSRLGRGANVTVYHKSFKKNPNNGSRKLANNQRSVQHLYYPLGAAGPGGASSGLRQHPSSPRANDYSAYEAAEPMGGGSLDGNLLLRTMGAQNYFRTISKVGGYFGQTKNQPLMGPASPAEWKS